MVNLNEVLYSSYDIKEKNKLKYFAKAKEMYEFIEKNVNIKKSKIKIDGNIIIIDDDFLIQGTSSLEIQENRRQDRISFDTYLTKLIDKEQILNYLELYNQIWFDNSKTEDYKEELLKNFRICV